MANTILTRWGKEIDPEHVLEEYPRPGMKREGYEILNGFWDYAITGSAEFPEAYDGRILVPFSPESELSGVNRVLKPDMYLSRHPGSTVWAIKNGTPAIYVADEYMIFGYKHTLEFAKTVLDAINNRSFEENLAKRTKLPYTDWWYQQNVDKFLEETK